MKCKPTRTEQLFDQANIEKSTLLNSIEEIEKEKQTPYLQIKIKYDAKIELTKKINNGKFINIFNYENIIKDEYGKSKNFINKIVMSNENLIPQIRNEINGKVHCISEIEEENQRHLIFSQNNGLYRLSKGNDDPELINHLKMYFILQINSNKYIFSCDYGTYIYEGSILNNKAREIIMSSKKIGEGGFKLGVKINENIVLVKKDSLMIINLNNINEKKNLENEENYSNFCENCYDLFKLEKDTNILLEISQVNFLK